MINLFYDCYQILSKVYADGAYLNQAVNETFIEEINRAKTTKIVYGVLDKDIELDYYLSKLCQTKPKQKIRIILKIAIYNLKFLQKKPFAVIDSAVELTKKLGKIANAGFVNAVLRKFVSSNISLPESEKDYLSVKYSYPKFALDKLISYYGIDLTKEIISFDAVYNFVRFNLGIDGQKYLLDNGYKFIKTPFNDLFAVENIKINQDFENGVWTFQSIGSVAICDAIGNGESLLDACSGPGGKSVNLSKKFKTVTSFEIHEHRAKLVEKYAKRMNSSNVSVIQKDSSVYDEKFISLFDTVLCDVPCSGYGTIKQNPDIKLKKVDKTIENLFETQYKILETCSKYVKQGGAIFYSTCSIFDDENDKVVNKFLQNNECFKVEKISSKLNCVEKKFGLQFLPNLSFGAGFYVSKLVRK